jgi:hypothetical protein
LAVGLSKLDDQCDKRETARSFLNVGQPQAALQILCTTKAATAAKLDVCKADPKQANADEPTAMGVPAESAKHLTARYPPVEGVLHQ